MWAMGTATRLAGNKKGKGNGDGNEGGRQQQGQWQWRQEQWGRQQGWQASGGDGNKEGDDDNKKGGGQATATAMKRAMGTTMRVAGVEEGNGNKQQEQ
jgi:hypothetical protein